MFKETRAWIASQLDQSTAQETPTDQPSGEQYATALKQFIDVSPRFELGPDVWNVNTSLTFQMLRVTFESCREAHDSIEATKEYWRGRNFDSRFKGYVRVVTDLVRPVVFDLVQALSVTGSDRKAAAIIWTQMTEGLIRPVTDHLVTVWIMWAINGTTEKKFKALADQYKYFCHPTSPCVPPKAIPVAGPRWMPDLDLEFKRATMEGEIQAAVIEALKQATGLKHHEVEALMSATPSHTSARPDTQPARDEKPRDKAGRPQQITKEMIAQVAELKKSMEWIDVALTMDKRTGQPRSVKAYQGWLRVRKTR